MSNANNIDYRDIIFSRYIGQFLQADEHTASVRKSSEDIAFDLSGMALFTPDEISMRMASFGYKIGFSDYKPVWLLREDLANILQE